MSGRSITGAMTTALAGTNLAPLMFAALYFDSGTVRVTNLAFDISWGGYTWTGAGQVGSIDAIVESEATQSGGIAFTLSGIPAPMISAALSEQYQGRTANVWLGFISGGAIVADPVLIFPGTMDNMQVVLGESASIRVNAENRLADFERARVRRWNNDDHQAYYPASKGFEYVEQMVEKSLYWGVANPPAASPV